MARLRNKWLAGLGGLCVAAAVFGCATEQSAMPSPRPSGMTEDSLGLDKDFSEYEDAFALTALAGERRVISFLSFEPSGVGPDEPNGYIRDRVWLDDQRVRTRDYAKFLEPRRERRIELLGEWVSEPTPLFPVVASLVRAHGELQSELGHANPFGAYRGHLAHGMQAHGSANLTVPGIDTYIEFKAMTGDSLVPRVATRWRPETTNFRLFRPIEAQMLEIYIRLFDARNTLPEDRTFPAPDAADADQREGN